MSPAPPTRIVGIDCAVDFKKLGLAFGLLNGDSLTIDDATVGRDLDSTLDRIASTIRQSPRTLLAMDSPLGWPRRLSDALFSHHAGDLLPHEANLLFRRDTDRFVRERTGKQSLDIGADRIARTAHAAITLLHRLAERLQTAVPVAWDPGFEDQIAAIEVYPALTLRQHGLPDARYKHAAAIDQRKAIADGLRSHLLFRLDTTSLERNAHMLDAVVCVLAGGDFLRSRCHAPDDPETARREGWIWFPKTAPSSE